MEHIRNDQLTPSQRFDAIGAQRSIFSQGEIATNGLLWVTDKRQAVVTYLQVRNQGTAAQVPPIDNDGWRRLSSGGLAFALSNNYDHNEGYAKIAQHLFEACIDLIISVARHIGEPGGWLWWDRLQIYRQVPTGERNLKAWIERGLRPYHLCTVVQVSDRLDLSGQSESRRRFWPMLERISGILSKGVVSLTRYRNASSSVIVFRERSGKCWDVALMETLTMSATSIFTTSNAHEESDQTNLAKVAVLLHLIEPRERREVLELPNWNPGRFDVRPPASIEYNDYWLKILLKYEFEAACHLGELVSRMAVIRCGRSRGRTSLIRGTKFVPKDPWTPEWRQKLLWMEGNALAEYLLNTSEIEHAWWHLNDSRVLRKRMSGICRLGGGGDLKEALVFVTLEGMDMGDMTCHCGGIALAGGRFGIGDIIGTTRIYFDNAHDIDIEGALIIVGEAALGAAVIRHNPWPWNRRRPRIMHTDT